MKVLIIGMQNVPNQFTRAMDCYEGVTWEHVDSDPGGHIPNCDAALLTTCQLSHTKYQQAKEVMKASGKPFLVTHSSFTKIKNDFEDLLRAKGVGVVYKVKLEPKRRVALNGVMDQAMRQAVMDVKPTFTDPVPAQNITRPELTQKVVDSMLNSPGMETPSYLSFNRITARVFSVNPTLGSQMRNLYFMRIEDQAAVLGVKHDDRHIGENLRDKPEAMQELVHSLARVWGLANVRKVKIMVTYKETINGMALFKLVKSWEQEGLGDESITDRLNRENYHKMRGEMPWNRGDVAYNRSYWTRKINGIKRESPLKNLPKVQPLPAAAKVERPAVPVTLAQIFPTHPQPVPVQNASEVPRAPSKPDELRVRDELIGKVLAMKNFDPLKKLELIEEINAGVRTVEHQVIPERKDGKLQLTAQSIFHPEDKPILLMDKALARDIVSVMNAIKQFAEEE